MSKNKFTRNSKRNHAKKKAAMERTIAKKNEAFKKEQDFINNTIDAQSFLVEDVIGDGACMYRALANCIYYGSVLISSELESLNNKCKKTILYNSLSNMHSERQYYDIDKFNDIEWGWNGNSQEIVARKLQQLSLRYITKYQNDLVDGDDSKLALKDVVETVHELTFEDYMFNYQYFAGDTVEITEVFDNDNDKDETKKEHTEIMTDRWGGFPEQYAISKIFDRPIYVYSAEKWNTRTNKINTGTFRNNKFVKNVRLRLCDIVNICGNGLPIYLLWNKTKRHYCAMILNNSE